MNIPKRTISSLILPRLADLIFLAAFGCAILLGPRLLNVDGDLGRHLVVGNYILGHRIIPTVDLFSNTMPGQALTPHEWLSEVIFAVFYNWLGLNGVVFLCGLLLGLTFVTLYKILFNRWKQPLLCLSLCLAALAVSSLHWLARPHLFTFLLFVIWLGGLEKLREGKYSAWWVFPIVMLFWANLHGAFIAGFVCWGIYFTGHLWDSWFRSKPFRVPGILYWLGSGLFSLAASLMNPAGIRLWSTSLGYIQNKYLVGHTAEYFSPDFHQVSTLPFLGLLIISILVIGLKKGNRPVTWVLLLAAWAGMGLISVRNVPLFAFAAAISLTGIISYDQVTSPGIEQRLAIMENKLTGWTWPVIFTILVYLSFLKGIDLDAQQQGNHFDPKVFPIAAVDWLEKNPQPGNPFNYFSWGGYLLYRDWPATKVFIDGQTDFYGEKLTREYETVIASAQGWDPILERYSVRWILIPGDSELAKTLIQSADWKPLYKDPVAVIYGRKN